MDQNSINILSRVHPKQRDLVIKLIDKMIGMGYDARVTQGLRTFAEQNSLYAQGRTKPGKKVTNAVGGQSNHNYGLANDITIYKNGKPDWNDLDPYRILGREAEKLGLEWGGRWKSVDMPHVQLKGMSVKECQAAYKQEGIIAVWQRMDQILGGTKPTVFVPDQDDLFEFGDAGLRITELQKQLAKLKYLQPHEVDGEFGKVTKNAVISFQRQNKLTADGIVGPGTKAKILEQLQAEQNKADFFTAKSLIAEPVSQPDTEVTEDIPQETTKVEVSEDGGVKIETSNAPPEPTKTEVVTAPPKEGSTSTAVKTTIAGIAVPAFIGVAVKSVTDLISQGYVSAADIGAFVLNLIRENQKYVLWIVVAIIILLGIKKLTKQITLWIQMWMAGSKDKNNVEIKPQ